MGESGTGRKDGKGGKGGKDAEGGKGGKGAEGGKSKLRGALEASLIGVFVLGVAHSVAAAASMRGWPMWMSIVGAALVFPVLPAAWQVWAERRRRKKDKPKPARTTAKERLLFRVLVVAALGAIGLSLTLGWSTFSALRHHSDWMIPEDSSVHSCESLAQGYVDRFERAAGERAPGDDLYYVAQVGQAQVHYQCVAGKWRHEDRACVAKALIEKSSMPVPYDYTFIATCKLDRRDLDDFDPDDGPSCAALGQRAVSTVARRIDEEPKLKGMSEGDKAAYAEHFRAVLDKSCTDREWNDRQRVCMDIGLRYTLAPVVCKLPLSVLDDVGELDAELIKKLRTSRPL